VKYLIVGLGNIGEEYTNTRHNIGFSILDALAEASDAVFTPCRYGDKAELRVKSNILVLLKPSTYVNLSGNAVRYWLKKLEVPDENLLVVVDDLALPFGNLRIRKQGSDGGHNGLKHIIQVLGRQEFARMRFGIGTGEKTFNQVNYVLGEWTPEEKDQLTGYIKTATEAIVSFTLIGISRTMSLFNRK